MAQRSQARRRHALRAAGLRDEESGAALAGGAAADHQLRLCGRSLLPDAAQPQLLVDLRRHPHLHADGADRDRGDPGHALHAPGRHGLQFRRAHHARRELRLAAALPALQRRLDVLPRRLHPHVPRHVLRLLQVAARGAVDPRRAHLPLDDGDRLHGLRAALGPDELLGRDRHHQPVLGDPDRRRPDRDLAVGRLLRRQSHPEPLLLAALPPAVRHSRRRRPPHLGAARGRAEQPGRRRSQGGEGHRAVHALRHHEGRARHRRVPDPLCVVRVLHPELSRPCRQLHPGQSRR